MLRLDVAKVFSVNSVSTALTDVSFNNPVNVAVLHIYCSAVTATQPKDLFL